MKKICVFCGSASGRSEGDYLSEAEHFGKSLAAKGMGLVYGGASIGVMGKIANSCLAAQGKVYGVIPEFLQRIEVGHMGLSDLQVVETMHERKQRMYDLSDAFVALPGGFGTLDELCEIMTWAQLKHHQKPCFILNSNGFYDRLLEHFDHLVQEQFLSSDHRRILRCAHSVEELMEMLAAI